MERLAEELATQRHEICAETRLRRQSIESRWRQPLWSRVQSGRALGPLTVREIESNGLIHFESPAEDIAIFREHDRLRLSKDNPEGGFHHITFVGSTAKGLTVYLAAASISIDVNSTGWSLDEDFLDLSNYYLDAIDELGSTIHGRENVAPVLFGGHDASVDLGIYAKSGDALEPSGLDESQIDAVATALASSPFHLIQGPPGTGKTYTLALLVAQLLEQNHRVLVTAFTHRAIHQALGKVKSLLGDRHPVVKIARRIPNENLPFDVFETYGESKLASHDGPFVIGATPFALWTKRLKGIRFDSIVLDETSQLTLPAAAMAMLCGDRWFFFGDHKQLPPVSFTHQDDPAAASVFARLARNTAPSTLNTTYRLNAPLTHWPSENFYGGELTAHSSIAGHRLALKRPASRYPAILAAEPSLLRIELRHEGRRSRSEEEADLAADLLADLFDAGLPPDAAGVVVPFRSQASAIRRLLRGDRFAHHRNADAATIDTVDRFQGQEREVILYSFASSDPDFMNLLGEFLMMPPRLNVAVTRAKTKVILLHSTALREYAESRASYSEAADLFLSLLAAATRIDV